MNTSIELQGIKAVQRSLDKLPKELRKIAERDVLRAGAKEILGAARSRVPEDTGNLKKALGVSVRVNSRSGFARIGSRSGKKYRSPKGKKTGRKARAGRIIEAEEYAFYLEYGNSRQSAQPFMRPAVESSGTKVVNAMGRGLEKGLIRAANRIKSRL